MEDAHRPLSYSPYAQPIPDNLVTQQSIYYPARPWSQQQSTQEPLLPMPRPINDQANEQPSMICGFTLSELAQVAIQVAGVTIAAVFGAWAIKAYESANIANQLSEDSLSQSNIANRLAQDALKQSSYANILAIINLCLSDQYRDSAVCPAILEESRFSSVVRDVIPNLSIISTTTTQRIPIPTSTSGTLPSLPASTTTTRTAAATTLLTGTATTRPTTTVTLSNSPSVGSNTSDSNSGSGNKPLAFGAIVGIIIGVVVVVAIICLALIRYRRSKRSRI